MNTFASYKELEDIVDKAQTRVIPTDEAFEQVLRFIKKGMYNGSFFIDDDGYFHYNSYNNPNPYLKSGGGSIIKMPDDNVTYYDPMPAILDKLNDEERAMKWIAMRLNVGLDEKEEREFFMFVLIENKTVRQTLEKLIISRRKYYELLEIVKQRAKDILILVPMD